MKNLFLLTLCFVAASCQETGTNEDLIFKDVPTLAEGEKVSHQQINDLIIKPFGCLNCHSAWAGSEEGLLKKIVPGEPFNSPLYLRIEDGTMPMGGASVDSSRLEYLERYIRQMTEQS